MIITKSEFIRFLHCPESFWLLMHKPEIYPHGDISGYERKIAAHTQRRQGAFGLLRDLLAEPGHGAVEVVKRQFLRPSMA